MTLEDLLHLTRRRIGSLVLALVVCVLASMLFAFVSPSTYTATSQAYLRVKVAGDPAQSTQSQYNAAQLAAMKADAVVPVFTSAAVAQRVVDSLKLDETAEEFASSVSATRVPETVSVQVSVTASSSHRAQVLADEVVRQASVEIKDLEGEDSPVEIVLLSSAELVSATRSPALVTCVAVGLLAGLVLGYVWILVQELLDKSLKGPEEVREALSVPLLGALPRVPSLRWLSRGAELKMEEQLRVARTNVLHALSQGGRRVMVVTSAGPQEGTSVTAASLARVLALSGHRVVLVGGDLRAPSSTTELRQSSDSLTEWSWLPIPEASFSWRALVAPARRTCVRRPWRSSKGAGACLEWCSTTCRSPEESARACGAAPFPPRVCLSRLLTYVMIGTWRLGICEASLLAPKCLR